MATIRVTLEQDNGSKREIAYVVPLKAQPHDLFDALKGIAWGVCYGTSCYECGSTDLSPARSICLSCSAPLTQDTQVMEQFRRVVAQPAQVGHSVYCAECGKLIPYNLAWIGSRPFKFYHEACAQALEAK